MQKNKRSVFHWLLLLCNCFFAGALLISYTASFIDPAAAWPVAFFGLAYPFLMFFNVLFVIYWTLRFRWPVLISVICIAIGWNIHQDHFIISLKKPAEPVSARSIKIMSYNAHLFKPVKPNKHDKKTKHEMLDMILSENASIICFQEFYTRNKGTYNILDSLKKAGYRYYFVEVFEQNQDEKNAMAIFSRYEIINKKLVPFYPHKHANMCTYADMLIDGDTIRVINIHLQSISFQPEDYEYLNRVTRDAETDMLSSRRIGSRLKKAFISRSNQAEIVRELVEASPYPVIVSGDFNDTPISYSFNLISKGLKNTFKEKGKGFGITYGGDFPNFQIDYILCSPRFEVQKYKVIKRKYSDHYPVVATLGF